MLSECLPLRVSYALQRFSVLAGLRSSVPHWVTHTRHGRGVPVLSAPSCVPCLLLDSLLGHPSVQKYDLSLVRLPRALEVPSLLRLKVWCLLLAPGFLFPLVMRSVF